MSTQVESDNQGNRHNIHLTHLKETVNRNFVQFNATDQLLIYLEKEESTPHVEETV